MEKGNKNKIIKEEKNKTENEQAYFYPTHGITIKASSKEEADKELAKLLKDNSV